MEEEPRVMVCGGHVSGLAVVWGDTMTQVVVWREPVTAPCCDKACWGPTCVALMSWACDSICRNMS